MGYKDPDKQREFQRNSNARRRAEFFNGKSCVQCGSIERLELDHIDRSTKIDHKIWSWRKERRDEELVKCQVLCFECHLEKTISETMSHGRVRYDKGCRCDICRAANAKHKREQRVRKKNRLERFV